MDSIFYAKIPDILCVTKELRYEHQLHEEMIAMLPVLAY